ncbi:hypothetical protein HYH03_003301 [Edaphochlamys debaryana]|uniref:Uncharacterized protein n=1 Tax=Edaphochlamys debaryana TaxID=47281 RepID=A0A836C396_9CHLO|nr:hypothetical protein HYH03_003301 [Edaphochlamys debaryana]|eukprot:KAG2498550.1 hypothetical protein HYH03_003301 [Edaphochlamys debaryana]
MSARPARLDGSGPASSPALYSQPSLQSEVPALAYPSLESTSSFDDAAFSLPTVGRLPTLVFAGLAGEWALRRRLDSTLPTEPSGVVTGIATFDPTELVAAAAAAAAAAVADGTAGPSSCGVKHTPTGVAEALASAFAAAKAAGSSRRGDAWREPHIASAGPGADVDSLPLAAFSGANNNTELLYKEEGRFKLDYGASMKVSRSYVYALTPCPDLPTATSAAYQPTASADGFDYGFGETANGQPFPVAANHIVSAARFGAASSGRGTTAGDYWGSDDEDCMGGEEPWIVSLTEDIGSMQAARAAELAERAARLRQPAEERQQLDVFFATRGGARDYHFHTMKFTGLSWQGCASRSGSGSGSDSSVMGSVDGGWATSSGWGWGCGGGEVLWAATAEGSHRCDRDAHTLSYTFNFRGPKLTSFEVRVSVVGPSVRYGSIAEYSRIK